MKIILDQMKKIADREFWETNPVYCISKIVKKWNDSDLAVANLRENLICLLEILTNKGIPIANSELKNWHGGLEFYPSDFSFIKKPDLGVSGLVINQAGSNESFLVPLEPTRGESWDVDYTLPFEKGTIQDLLAKILRTFHPIKNIGVPERFAFTFKDRFSQKTGGHSMDVAAVLSIIRLMNDCPQIFDRSCAMVQVEKEKLIEVGYAQAKLSCFIRERGCGTLLVCCTNSLKKWRESFDEVWEVDTLKQLADKLYKSNYLDVFFDKKKISPKEAGSILSSCRELKNAHQLPDALELLTRSLKIGFEKTVTNKVFDKINNDRIDLLRHLGNFDHAEKEAKKNLDDANNALITSYDCLANATLKYAAAFYDSHNFLEIKVQLSPWLKKINKDPLVLHALTRLKIFNTLARSLVILNEKGWESLFLESEKILQVIEPSDLPRTWNYLAHAYLKKNDLEKADVLLKKLSKYPSDDKSRNFISFLKAELARRNNEIWADVDLDCQEPSSSKSSEFLFDYFQATARQSGREYLDAINRFDRAIEFIQWEEKKIEKTNIFYLLKYFIQLAKSAKTNDVNLWRGSIREIGGFFKKITNPFLKNFYKDFIPPGTSNPCEQISEKILCRVPYF
jgi:tetratricopeptide (TPR) repeat protein